MDEMELIAGIAILIMGPRIVREVYAEMKEREAQRYFFRAMDLYCGVL